MKRRSFLQFIALVFAGLALPFGLTGCGASTTTIAAFINLIGKDAAALATYFGATSTATQIIALAAQIATDVTNWQSGGAATDAINAINDLIGLINSIPVAVPYAPLIILILSALTGLLALLPQSPGTLAAKSTAQRKYQINPTHYADATNKTMTKAAKDFTSAWQSQLATTPLK
jgi:hypothetical protein